MKPTNAVAVCRSSDPVLDRNETVADEVERRLLPDALYPKRRLLLVSDTTSGGHGAAVLAHCEWFTRHGWDVAVAAPSDGRVGSSKCHVPIPIPRSVRNVRGVIGASSALHRLCRAMKPTVIHCYGARSFLVSRLAQRRTPYFTLYFIGSMPDDPPLYHALRNVGLRTLPLLASTAFSGRPDAPHGYNFLPNASPSLNWMTSWSPFVGDGIPTFLWLGRLSEPKRPEIFVEALAEAAKVREVRGVMTGVGSLADSVRHLIDRLSAPITLVGHVEDPLALLAGCNALCLFSRDECLTYAVQEAMWMGRPVIASPLPGLRWLVGDAGVLSDDVATICRQMIQLCDSDEVKRQGNACATRIHRLLTPDLPWPETEKAYLMKLDA
jgi:glycosyltransferase involved in cell wall biosynthesis